MDVNSGVTQSLCTNSGFVERHWQVSWCGEALTILCVLTWTQPCSLLRWRRTGLLSAFLQVTNCSTLRRRLGSLLRSHPVTPSGLWQILSSCENWWVGRPGFIFCFFSRHPHLLNFLFLPFFWKRERKQKDRLPLAYSRIREERKAFGMRPWAPAPGSGESGGCVSGKGGEGEMCLNPQRSSSATSLETVWRWVQIRLKCRLYPAHEKAKRVRINGIKRTLLLVSVPAARPRCVFRVWSEGLEFPEISVGSAKPDSSPFLISPLWLSPEQVLHIPAVCSMWNLCPQRKLLLCCRCSMEVWSAFHCNFGGLSSIAGRDSSRSSASQGLQCHLAAFLKLAMYTLLFMTFENAFQDRNEIRVGDCCLRIKLKTQPRYQQQMILNYLWG